MKKTVALMNMLFTLLFAGSAVSAETRKDQDLAQIEEVVVTATMTEKILKEAPGSVEVISEQELLEMNAETVADALEEATGLVMTTETGRMMRPSIRGTGNKHTLVLIDGRRITSGLKDLQGLEQLPVDMIKRIEVVRGPASALYGSDAMGGVINIITKRPSETLTMDAGAQYGQSTYGEGDEFVGSAAIGNSVDRFGFLLAGGYRDKDGYDRDGVTPDDGDSTEMKSTGGRFSYKINKNNGLFAGFETIDRDFVGLRNLQNLDRIRDVDDRRLNYFLEYDGQITQHSALMLLANRSEHEDENKVVPPTPKIAGEIGDEDHAKRTLNQLEGRFTSMIFEKHLLTLGTEYVEKSREDDAGLDDSFDTFSIYTQDEYKIFAPLYLVLGIRWDDYSNFGSEWTPRASIIYSIVDNLRLKTSYGKGFRAPDFTELFVPTYMQQGKQIYEPNPHLDAESSESYEVGIEGEYKRFQGRITWFHNSIEDLIEAVYDRSTGSGRNQKNYYQCRNIAEADMSGLEIECSLKLPAGFALSGNIAYLQTEDKTTGKDLEGRPDYKGSMKLGYQYLPFGVRANIRVNYMGERTYAAGNEGNLTLVNAYVSKNVTKTVMLFAGVDNLFNTGENDYEEPTFFYGGVRFSY